MGSLRLQLLTADRDMEIELMINMTTDKSGLEDNQILQAIKRYNDSGDQLEIRQFIKRNNLSLMTNVKDNSGEPTVLLETLLEDTINGNKIVEKILDDCVSDTAENENSKAHSVEIDWSPLLDKGKNQTCVLSYLLRMRNHFIGGDFCPYSDLLKHPALEIFTKLKWKRYLKYFYFQSVIFFSFLLVYSTFLASLLNSPVTRTRTRDSITNCTKFMEADCDGFIVCEILLLTLTLLLTISEIFQAFKLKQQYWKEMENRFYSYSLLSAYLCMAMKSSLLDTEGLGPALRGLAAIGILFSWLELIFVVGRIPYRGFGGCLSVMFYNIIRKLFSYMIAMIIMITGHAMAFMVIGFGHIDKNKEEEEVISFDNPFKAIVKTLTMALGEFDLNTLYNSVAGDNTSHVFALILLVVLAMLGTVTLVNLFIAVTMSDMEKLKRDVNTQQLVNMASFVILIEDSLPRTWLADVILQQKMVFCSHDICTKDVSPATPNII